MENATAAIDLVIINDNATSVFEENEGEYWTLMGIRMRKELLFSATRFQVVQSF